MSKLCGTLRALLTAFAAFGILAVVSPGRAAVMTWNVNVTFNGSGYDVSYNLVSDVTDMTVRIYKSATPPVLVKTLNASSNPAITSYQMGAGAHTIANGNQVVWNGDIDAGGNASGGQYFAQITTTGAPVTAMASLVAAKNQTTYTDGRFCYNGGAALDASSIYHNTFYWPNKASTSGSTTQREGVAFWNPDLSTTMLDASTFATKAADGTPVGNSNATGSGISNAVSVLPDGNIVVSNGSTVQGGKFIVLKPSATNAGTPATNTTGTTFGTGIYTRAMRAFGTSSAPRIFYITDAASTTFTTGAMAVNYVDYATPGATPTAIIPATSFPVTERSLAVNRANDTIWVGGSSLGPNGTVTVQRWTRTGALPGTWAKNGFASFAIPAALTAAGSVSWVELSPDENILWVAIGGGSVSGSTITAVAGQEALIGVDPTTGAPITDQLLTGSSVLRDWPEQIVQTGTYDPDTGTYHNGNLIIPSYGSITQTTGRGFQIIAPVDNGSTDITRSRDFTVVVATKVSLLTGPTAAVTYHGATVSWTTDIQSDTVLEYGTSSGSYTTVSTPDPVTNHSITVDNLEKNTLYYYRVTSNAGSLTPAQSTEKTFTTSPLTISGVAAVKTDNGATINWTTNEPATSLLHYGTKSGELTKLIEVDTLATSHSINVVGYKPGTVLYYQPESGYYLAPPAFSTPPTPTLGVEASVTVPDSVIFSNLRISAGADSATVSFDTNIAATAAMVWGITTAPTTVVADTGTPTSHIYTITGLAPGTTYYYIPTLTPADASLAARTLPVSTFVTSVLGGTATSVTHATPDDVALSQRTELEAPASGSLFKLAMQGVPTTPVQGPDLPAARHFCGVVVYNGYMYVIGGRASGGTYFGQVWYNKIDSNGVIGGDPSGTPTPWIANPANDLPGTRAQISNMCFGYNGYIYVVGGVDVSVIDVNTVWYAKQNPDGSLSLPTGATAVTAGFPWAATTALPVARSLGSARVVDGWVLVSGGRLSPNSAANYLARIKPDGTLGSWYTARPMNATKTYQRTVANNHLVYSIGGQANPGTNITDTEDISSMMPDRDLTPWIRLTNDPAHVDAVMDNPGDGPDFSGHWGMASELVRGKIVSVAGRLNTDPTNRNNPATLSSGIAYTKLDASGMPGAWVDATANDSSIAYPQGIVDLDGAAWNGSMYTAGGRYALPLGATVATVQIPMVDDGTSRVYSGTAESQMIDLGSLTNLKHFSVTGTNVSPSTVEARYRFANTEGNFTDWITPANLDADISGGAKWFQYELVLKGDGSGTPIVSNVTVTTGSFGKVAFTTQPGAAAPGLPFGVQPVVTVQDSAGTTLAGYTGPVTIALKPGTGPTGAILSGTLTVNAVAGVATFTDLWIDQIGTGYVLTATAGAISTESAPFAVGVQASKVAFTTSPGGAPTGSPLAPQPVVSVEDASGNVVTSFTGPVTLAIKAGSGTAGAILGGTTSVNAVAGIATFSGLSIDKAGTDYVLTASSGALATADSEAFTITTAPYVLADVVSALRRAGGLDVTSPTDFGRLNVVTGDATEAINIKDAIRLARKVKGKDINP